MQRLIHRLAEDHTRSLALQRHLYPLATNRTSTIERLTQRIDHATEHLLADHNRRRTSRTLDRGTLLDAVGRAEQYGTHVILFEVHHHSAIAILKLQQLARFGIAQAIDACHAVAHLQHRAHLGKLRSEIDTL